MLSISEAAIMVGISLASAGIGGVIESITGEIEVSIDGETERTTTVDLKWIGMHLLGIVLVTIGILL